MNSHQLHTHNSNGCRATVCILVLLTTTTTTTTTSAILWPLGYLGEPIPEK